MGEAEGGEGVKGLRSSVLGSCSSRGATLAGFFFLSFFFLSSCLFRASPTAYGGSQARGRTGAVAAGLRSSHSNTRSEPCL